MAKVGNNWMKLKQRLHANNIKNTSVTLGRTIRENQEIPNLHESSTQSNTGNERGRKRTKSEKEEERRVNREVLIENDGSAKISSRETRLTAKMREKVIGLDCEMVGIGLNGEKSVLARCCLVDFDGNVLYDRFVRPQSVVTDFRTKYSGVRKCDLKRGEAVSFAECQRDVAALLKGKILVGHALKNDLTVLLLSHPRKMTRDTAAYRPYMRPKGRNGGKFRPRALRDLSAQIFGIKIQSGEHDPAEDARTAVMLYRHQLLQWEDSLRDLRRQQHNGAAPSSDGGPESKGEGHGQGSIEEPSSSADRPISGEGDGESKRAPSTSTADESQGRAKGMFSEVTVPGTRSLQDVERERRKKKTVRSGIAPSPSQSHSRARVGRVEVEVEVEAEKEQSKKRRKIR